MRRTTGVLALGLACGVAAAGEVGPWEQLFLRSHIMLVHFPIALVLVAALFEAVHMASGVRRRGEQQRRPPVSGAALGLLAIGAALAALSAWSGWERAEHEPPSSSLAALVNLHRWLGISLAGTSFAAVVLGLLGRGGTRRLVGLYRTLLVVSAGLVMATGHLGGSIVWGEGYLLDPLEEAVFGAGDDGQADGGDRVDPPEGGVVDGAESAGQEATGVSTEMVRAAFERDVRAIFDARCIKCHGAEKVSGHLRLQTWEDVESAIDGRAGVIVSGFPEFSEMVYRISLPEGDEDLMPGDDSGRLSEDEIAKIRAWIESLDTGAVTPSAEDGEAKGGDEPIEIGDDQTALVDLAMGRVRDAGGYASRLSLSDDSVVVNLSMLGSRASDETLAMLDGLAGVLVELDLGATAVGDAGVATLARFERLQRLDLSRTAVTSAVVAALVTLDRLDSLNLYGTRVDDGAVESLAAMAGLKKLYLWDSGFTDEGVAALRSRLEGCEVDFGDAGLREPVESGDGG